MSNIKELITEFILELKKGDIEIYNEASLQLELIIFLRDRMPDFLVQTERNISHFNITSKNSAKKVMDICIFSEDKSQLLCAIELKCPRNGQHPMQMFNFCKDISFMEHVKKNGFSQAFVLILGDDKKFYDGTSDAPPYNYFRGQEPITGYIPNTINGKDDAVSIDGSYVIEWNEIKNPLKYTLIEVV